MQQKERERQAALTEVVDVKHQSAEDLAKKNVELTKALDDSKKSEERAKDNAAAAEKRKGRRRGSEVSSRVTAPAGTGSHQEDAGTDRQLDRRRLEVARADRVVMTKAIRSLGLGLGLAVASFGWQPRGRLRLGCRFRFGDPDHDLGEGWHRRVAAERRRHPTVGRGREEERAGGRAQAVSRRQRPAQRRSVREGRRDLQASAHALGPSRDPLQPRAGADEPRPADRVAGELPDRGEVRRRAAQSKDKYDHAKDYILLLDKQIGEVEVTCQKAGTKVSVDGKEVFTAPGTWTGKVRAGKHTIVGTLEGHPTRVDAPYISPGAPFRIELKLYTTAELTRYRRKWDATWVPYAVMGGGVLIALGGGGMELLASNDYKKYDDQVTACNLLMPGNMGCAERADLKSIKDSGDTKKTAGYVLYGIGAAAVDHRRGAVDHQPARELRGPPGGSQRDRAQARRHARVCGRVAHGEVLSEASTPPRLAVASRVSLRDPAVGARVRERHRLSRSAAVRGRPAGVHQQQLRQRHHRPGRDLRRRQHHQRRWLLGRLQVGRGVRRRRDEHRCRRGLRRRQHGRRRRLLRRLQVARDLRQRHHRHARARSATTATRTTASAATATCATRTRTAPSAPARPTAARPTASRTRPAATGSRTSARSATTATRPAAARTIASTASAAATACSIRASSATTAT